MANEAKPLTPELAQKIDAHWRAANYLSVGQIYLYDNPLLEEPLARKHIFHLVADVIDRLPQLGSRAAYAKQAINNKLIEHKHYIAEHGDDMPEIANWRWGRSKTKATSTEGDNV